MCCEKTVVNDNICCVRQYYWVLELLKFYMLSEFICCIYQSICSVIIYAFEYIYIEVICAACGDNRSRGPPAICEAEVILRFSKILRNSIPFLQYCMPYVDRLLWRVIATNFLRDAAMSENVHDQIVEERVGKGGARQLVYHMKRQRLFHGLVNQNCRL